MGYLTQCQLPRKIILFLKTQARLAGFGKVTVMTNSTSLEGCANLQVRYLRGLIYEYLTARLDKATMLGIGAFVQPSWYISGGLELSTGNRDPCST